MKYYIIAGEASGDLHGSLLIKALKKLDTKADIRCWGGDLMEKQDAKVVKHYKDIAFMGFWEVLKNISAILKNIRFCKQDILSFQPDVIVYIDYPGFNLRIARWAKSKGFKNHYYISPQVWAWKENRVHGMKKTLDALYVILPFEKSFFEEKHQFPVHYVGHPLMETIPNRRLNKDFLKTNKLPKKPIIALLPGSRKQEIKKMLPIFLEVAQTFKGFQFAIAGAPGIPSDWYAPFVQEQSNVSLLHNQTYDLLQHSKAAIVTSGTATLEAALFRVPLLVCYKTSPVSYQIGKRVVKLKYISLVNLILDKEAVTELIQSNCTPNRISEQLHFIASPKGKKEMDASFKNLASVLAGAGASSKTAGLIYDAVRKKGQTVSL